MWNLASRELNLLGCEEKRAPGLFGGGDGQVQRGLEATRGKVGASSSCLCPYPTLRASALSAPARPWVQRGPGTGLAQRPRRPPASPEDPCQRAAAGPPGASVASGRRTSRRRRPRPCSLRWRAGAEASCSEVSTLERAHLSDGSTPAPHWAGPHTERRCSLQQGWQIPFVGGGRTNQWVATAAVVRIQSDNPGRGQERTLGSMSDACRRQTLREGSKWPRTV